MPNKFVEEIWEPTLTVFKHGCLTFIMLAIFGTLHYFLQKPIMHAVMDAWVYNWVSFIDGLALAFSITWFAWEMAYEIVTNWRTRTGFMLLAF
jgi:hypothetical protein